MRADAQASRRSLLDAARRLIAEQGPQVPLSAVAAASSVSIASLYRHFPSRGELLFAIVEEISDQVVEIADQRRAEWDADPVRTWTGFVRELAELHLSGLVTQLATAPVLAALPSRAIQLRQRAVAAVDNVVALARHAGLAGADVTSIRFLIGLAMLTRPLPDFPPSSLPSEHDWLISTYLHGLRPLSPDDEPFSP